MRNVKNNGGFMETFTNIDELRAYLKTVDGDEATLNYRGETYYYAKIDGVWFPGHTTKKTLVDHLSSAGSAKTEKKATAARKNGKRGGRPPAELLALPGVYITTEHNGGGFVDYIYKIDSLGRVWESYNLTEKYTRITDESQVREPADFGGNEGKDYLKIIKVLRK